jgi:2,4-dienoyl-CoA reductase-like NADH-dependent reductase (Old Yellow Enzyme family)
MSAGAEVVMSSDLFEPLQLGDLRLANRMVMAPTKPR